jgi:hypothetical protein
MKKLCTLFFLVVALLFSHNSFAQTAKTAIELNDQLASITDSLYARGQEWGSQFNTLMNGSKDFKSLAKYRLGIEKFIDRKLAEIRVMKDINGSGELRQAMTEFLTFEKHMIQAGFMPAEKLGTDATDEQIQKIIENLTNESKREGDVLNKVRQAQEAYGKKNGFSIESDKAEE